MGQTESGMNWFLTSRVWARVPSAWLSSHRFLPFAHGWRGETAWQSVIYVTLVFPVCLADISRLGKQYGWNPACFSAFIRGKWLLSLFRER